jgi:hypothetical protein
MRWKGEMAKFLLMCVLVCFWFLSMLPLYLSTLLFLFSFLPSSLPPLLLAQICRFLREGSEGRREVKEGGGDGKGRAADRERRLEEWTCVKV